MGALDLAPMLAATGVVSLGTRETYGLVGVVNGERIFFRVHGVGKRDGTKCDRPFKGAILPAFIVLTENWYNEDKVNDQNITYKVLQ